MFDYQIARLFRVLNRNSDGVPYIFARQTECLYFVLVNIVYGDKVPCIIVFEFERSAFGGDFAAVQNHDVIRVRRLFHIVRRQKHRHVLIFAQRRHYAPKSLSRFGIESRRRLVQNENFGIVEQCARNVHSSLLSARKFAESAVEYILKFKKFGKMCNPLFCLFAGDAVKRGSRRQIVFDGQFCVKHGVLKHDAQLFGNLAHVLAVDKHLASIFCKHTAHDGYRRGFACAVYTQKRKQFALFDAQRQIVDRVDVLKTLVQIVLQCD